MVFFSRRGPITTSAPKETISAAYAPSFFTEAADAPGAAQIDYRVREAERAFAIENALYWLRELPF